MIAKFAGACSKCAVIIPKGEECIYDVQAKAIAHPDCSRPVAAARDPHALAIELGYLPHSDAIRVDWTTWKPADQQGVLPL